MFIFTQLPTTVHVAWDALGLKQRWPQSLFQTPTPLLFQNFWIWFLIRVRKFLKFENPTLVQTPVTIINPTLIYPCFYLRKWRHRLLRLPKSKSDSGSGLSQIFESGSGSGSERKTQNPARIDSGTTSGLKVRITSGGEHCSLSREIR